MIQQTVTTASASPHRRVFVVVCTCRLCFHRLFFLSQAAIKELCENPHNRSDILDADALPSLFEHAGNTDSRVRGLAIWTLAALAEDSKNRIKMMARPSRNRRSGKVGFGGGKASDLMSKTSAMRVRMCIPDVFDTRSDSFPHIKLTFPHRPVVGTKDSESLPHSL